MKKTYPPASVEFGNSFWAAFERDTEAWKGCSKPVKVADIARALGIVYSDGRVAAWVAECTGLAARTLGGQAVFDGLKRKPL